MRLIMSNSCFSAKTIPVGVKCAFFAAYMRSFGGLYAVISGFFKLESFALKFLCTFSTKKNDKKPVHKKLSSSQFFASNQTTREINTIVSIKLSRLLPQTFNVNCILTFIKTGVLHNYPYFNYMSEHCKIYLRSVLHVENLYT